MDSGFLYALVDETDSHSAAVKNSLQEIYEEVILPVPAITETAHFIFKESRRFGTGKFYGKPICNECFI